MSKPDLRFIAMYVSYEQTKYDPRCKLRCTLKHISYSDQERFYTWALKWNHIHHINTWSAKVAMAHLLSVLQPKREWKEDPGWVFVCWIVTGWYKSALAGVLIISSQNKQHRVAQVSSIPPTIDPTSA